MPKIKCTITDVVPIKKHKQNPIVAHYQNGTLSDEFASNSDVCLATDTQDDKLPKVLLTVSNNNAYDGYVGKDFPTDLKRTFIGIHKKDTNELKLVEVSECNLMSYHYNNCAKKKVESTNEFSSMSSESARRILFKDFGGKKAMKVLDRKEKMKINVDVVKDQLDKTLLEIHNSLVGTTGEDEFDKVKTEQDQILEDMVPKMNKEATKLVDVYRLTDLIGEEILDSLRDDAIKVLKASPADSPIKRKFLVKVIDAIRLSKCPDDSENLLKVQACIYIDALITYFTQVNNTRLNSAVRLQPISQATSKLTAHIKKKFSQPNISKLTKTNYVVHKATCYIIVLSLLISDRYEMDIQNIVEEIGISKTNLFKIITSIAVRPKSKSSIVGIRLPSQLKVLTNNFRKRRTL